MYLGVSGITDSNVNSPGILYWGSTNRLIDISDGTSNTLMVGERPPSKDLEYGWWFAGAGYSQGLGDVVLGARETGYAAALGCPSSYANFMQGSLNQSCLYGLTACLALLRCAARHLKSSREPAISVYIFLHQLLKAFAQFFSF